MKLNPRFSPTLELPLPPNPTGLFSLGTVVATEGVRASLCPQCIGLALKAHNQGQWGRVSQWDALANNDALKNGGRILSKFHGNDGIEFVIITEADRQTTTVALPEEL